MPVKYFSKWRTILRWVFVLGIIALAAQAGRLVHLQIKARTDAPVAPVGTPIPYTVTLREIIHGPDGTVTLGPEITQAIRSDGSNLWRWKGKGSQRTINLSSGLKVDTNDLDNNKTSMMMPNQNPANWQRNPNSKCLNSFAGKPFTSPPETFLGEETIAGYRTAKIASDGITSWHALDYGCAQVKERWDFSNTEFTEKELVSLVAGEPDATLFDVPAHYREVPPSERILGPKKENRVCDEHTLKLLQRLDENYKRLAVKPQ